jgi:hypothetical protein
MLDFFVHPALFWLFGMRSAERVVQGSKQRIELNEESEADTNHAS